MYPRMRSFTSYGYFSIVFFLLLAYPFKVKKEKWCYAEIIIPSKHKTIEKELLNPNDNKRVKELEFIKKEDAKSIPILCEKDLTKHRLNKIRKALQEKGYNTNNIQVSMVDKLLIPLSLYQKENNLAIGYYSVETLKALDINLQFLYFKKGAFLCYEKNLIQDNIKTILDTINSHGELRVIQRKETIEKGGYKRYEPCLCVKDLNKMKIKKIKRRLNEKGYELDEKDGINYIDLQRAFVKFQKDNKLPIGRLNLKTLDALNINY